MHTRQQQQQEQHQQQQQQGWNIAQTECTAAEKGGCGLHEVCADGLEAEAEVQVGQSEADLLRQRLRAQRLAAARLVFARLAASATSLELGCVRCLAALGAHCKAEAAAAEAAVRMAAEPLGQAAGAAAAAAVPRANGTAQAPTAGETLTLAAVHGLALAALAVQAHAREGPAGGGLGAGLGDLGDVDPG